MKHALPACLLVLTTTPLFAQETPEELQAKYPELLSEYPPLPHTNLVKGSDSPEAIAPYIPTLMMLYGRFGREFDGMGSAVHRFADHYNVENAVAAAMVNAIRQLHSELDEAALAQRKAFCARNFSNASSWKAAALALDADGASAQMGAFNKLRDIAGQEAWEKIVLDANVAARSIVIIQEDYDSVIRDIGYDTAFSRQCRNILERN